MLVYLINLALILVFGYIFLYRYKSEKNTKSFCGIAAVQWLLVSGLRHWSIGTDTQAYYYRFHNIKYTSWETLFNNLWDYLFNGGEIKDPGYDLLEKFFQIFSSDYQLFLLFIASIYSITMAIWIYRNSDAPLFSFVLYSTLFYEFFAVTGHRQTVATALIVFWGYKYIKERKLIKFAALALVAFLIHKSSIVFAPFYFIANIHISPLYVVFALITILAIFLAGESLYGTVVKEMGFNEDYLINIGGAENYALLLTTLCIAILIFYNYYKKYDEKKATHIFNATLLTLASTLLVFKNQGFMRIQQYYALFLMISFPEFIKGFDIKSRRIIMAVSILILIIYMILKNHQYRFFFM